MKTLLTILMVSLFGVTVIANPGSKADYLVTKDGKVVVAKVHLGFFKIHAKATTGCILDANYNDVVSYHKNGETYVKKPLYDGKVKTDMVFMRLVSWRNGLSLYCYDDPSDNNSKKYFVFKDDNTFVLQVEPKNSETIRTFFSSL
jgi:hypothetical protein